MDRQAKNQSLIAFPQRIPDIVIAIFNSSALEQKKKKGKAARLWCCYLIQSTEILKVDQTV